MFAEAHEVADEAAAAEGCTVEWEHIFRIPPMPFHPALLDAARSAVREVEGHDVELPSGALHDASEMARAVPTVMIFSSRSTASATRRRRTRPTSTSHGGRSVRPHLPRAIDLIATDQL